jgi:hypothetical protein
MAWCLDSRTLKLAESVNRIIKSTSSYLRSDNANLCRYHPSNKQTIVIELISCRVLLGENNSIHNVTWLTFLILYLKSLQNHWKCFCPLAKQQTHFVYNKFKWNCVVWVTIWLSAWRKIMYQKYMIILLQIKMNEYGKIS